jgi:hypothetical protein
VGTRRWVIMRVTRRAAAVVAAVITGLASLGAAGAAAKSLDDGVEAK